MGAHTDHPIRSRFNAWFMAKAEPGMHLEYGERKQRLLGEIPPTVVELGPGCGANFRYYPAGTRVIAVEPNPAMLGPMRSQADRHGIEIDLRHAGAEGIDLESGSADLVVCTLVLCSVRDPEQVLREARRVLGPRGRFVFLEHVAAPAGTRLRSVQESIRRPWKWLGEGCDLTRDTGSAIESAGFSSVEVERFDAAWSWAPWAPLIAGVAIR